MPNDKQGLVFISCGQFRPEEIRLGQDLATTIDAETDFMGYFAQNQTSLEGLSRNIFDALRSCAGFVAVMHNRGTVTTLHDTLTRGSVWVEQEIAIAAFLKQAHGRNIQVAVYVQRGIKREGVRDQLHLNPIEFDSEDEVLADFRSRLRDGRFPLVRLQQAKEGDVDLDFQMLNTGGGDVHIYRLKLVVTNSGTEPLTDYWIDLEFPKAALIADSIAAAAIKSKEDSKTHVYLRILRKTQGKDLYPGDSIVLTPLEYRMDWALYDSRIREERVVASFGSPGMTMKRVEKAFRQLQKF